MKKVIDKYPELLLVLIGAGLYGLNLVDLKVSIMEARNFIVAREMLTENHWLLTTMNDVARYEKPPFPAWFTTPFARIFGVDHVWAYRIPTSLFSVLGIIFFYKFVRIWNARNIAFYTALILSTSFYYIVIRFEAPSDMYTHVNMLMGIYFLMKDYQHIYSKNIFLGGLFLGLSILSKGPVGPYALFLPFILAYFISFKTKLKHEIIKVLGFLIIGLMIGGSWYLYVRFADPQTLLEITAEETGNWTNYNIRPFYYYWSFFIQSGIWTIPSALSLAYPYFIKRVKDKKLYKFSFLWTIIALVLLSIIPEKKPRYLFPVLFPLALNTALILNYLVSDQQNKISKYFHYSHYSILMLVCFAIPVAPLFLDLQWSEFWIFHVILSLCAFAILFFIFKNLKQKRYNNLIWSNVFIILMITIIGQSRIDIFQQNQNYKLLNFKSLNQNTTQTYYYKSIPPEIIWEYGEITKKWSQNQKTEQPYRILVSKDHLKDFKTKHPKLSSKINPEIFDRNYYRTGKRKHDRFITYVFEIEK